MYICFMIQLHHSKNKVMTTKRATKAQKEQYKKQVWTALGQLGYYGDRKVHHYNTMCRWIDANDYRALWNAQFGSKHGNYYRVVCYDASSDKYVAWEGWENQFPKKYIQN
jgi:hypothetical protein